MIHLDLDGAWSPEIPAARHLDFRQWGPPLRYCAPSQLLEKFYAEVAPRLENDPFLLYGSGDFHYLSGLWVRRLAARGPFSLVSFDNHPDWDIRPPRWACGGWINRALELEHVDEAAVWGCGNFELNWPNRLFANRRAQKDRRLFVYAWEERYPRRPPGPWSYISRQNWRAAFSRFAAERKSRDFYVTIDLDGLRAEEAATNWENGLFTADDIVWALGELRSAGAIIGGDLCGAWSQPAYARWTQAFAGGIDHPKITVLPEAEREAINLRTRRRLQPALIGTQG